MTIAVGQKIPATGFVKPTAEGPQGVSSDEFFAGKRVALFSVPGAFTPTCSAKHLPGFVQHAADLKAKAVDYVVWQKPYRLNVAGHIESIGADTAACEGVLRQRFGTPSFEDSHIIVFPAPHRSEAPDHAPR